MTHWMGTDDLGRDVFARLLLGTRVSLSVGFVAVGIQLLIGVTLGLIDGFWGGKLDNLIMRLVDIMLSIPTIFLILAVLAFLGFGMASFSGKRIDKVRSVHIRQIGQVSD